MITTDGLAALRTTATLVHTVPGLSARLRDPFGVRLSVARDTGGHPDDGTVEEAMTVTPCAFRNAVLEARRLHDCGQVLAFLDLDADPAIDVGVASGGRSWPAGIHRVPLVGSKTGTACELERRSLYTFATLVGAETCKTLGTDLVATVSGLDGLLAFGVRGDQQTEVSIVYVELAAPLADDDELVLIDALETLLFRCAVHELLESVDLHVGQ